MKADKEVLNLWFLPVYSLIRLCMLEYKKLKTSSLFHNETNCWFLHSSSWSSESKGHVASHGRNLQCYSLPSLSWLLRGLHDVLVLSERTQGIKKCAFIQTVPLHCHHFFLSRASITLYRAQGQAGWLSHGLCCGVWVDRTRASHILYVSWPVVASFWTAVS